MRVQQLAIGQSIQVGDNKITRLPNKNGKVRIGIEGPAGGRFVADIEGAEGEEPEKESGEPTGTLPIEALAAA